LVSTPWPEPNARLDAQTKTFTDFLASACKDADFRVTDVFRSGNVPDGPSWVFEAIGEDSVMFNVEVVGPAYESEPD
jgi:hypothetical protein